MFYKNKMKNVDAQLAEKKLVAFATPLARKEFASKLLIICVEHLVKANRKMRLELSANQSGTLNECKRKRSMNLVRGTKIELGLFLDIRVKRKENNYV